MNKALSIFLVAAMATAIGCGKNNQDNNDANNTSPANNTTPDMTSSDMGSDMTGGGEDMDGEDMSGDMTADMEEYDGGPCEDIAACAEDEICFEGRCKKTQACGSFRSFGGCRTFVEEMGADPSVKERTFCDGSYCRIACVRDSHCRDGYSCTDNGACVPFSGDITGVHPGGDARAPFKAGVGNELMHFPIGLPLGGYGSRAGNDGERYSDALGASWGEMHGLYARAILLDSGDRQMMLIRMPIIFPTAPLHEAVARDLQEKTGRDWRDSLVISGTHTHSGPGRYLHLPPSDQAALPLGAFGTDWFNEQAFDWVVDSATGAADQALADLSDAKFGWEIVEAFDTDDALASDRWGATPPFDDNRLLLMRVDGLDDKPRALLFSFGMHGTINSSDYATGDSMGGIERKLEERFGEEYDRFVPTLFFNENGGTMSPRGGRAGHEDHQKLEYLGYTFVDRMWENIQGMEMGREVTLAGKTHRFPLGYEELGYAPGEWTSYFPGDKDNDLLYGGLQCKVGSTEDSDPATSVAPEENTCAGIAGVLYNRPPSLFLRSQITALQINGLTVVTLPGEASMELGWQVLRDMGEEYNIDPLTSWIWGYAQDHQFYLTPTNLRGPLPPFPGISTPMAPDEYPDFAFSYYQGGYEAGFTIWGSRMGDFLVERAIEATGLMLGAPTDPKFETPYPLAYTRRGDPPFEILSTPEDRVGVITTQPPTRVKRLAPIEFAWLGGDPGAELPQAPYVALEQQEEDGSWSRVKHTNTRDYSNREPLMLTRLRRNEETEEWEWVVYWEELKDFPKRIYRFHVEGHYLSESNEREPYTASSDPFTLSGTDEIELQVEKNGLVLSGTAGYPAATKIVNPKTLLDQARPSGNYRMRHPEVPTGVSDPVEDVDTIEVTVLDAQNNPITLMNAPTITTTKETVGGRDGVPVTRFEVSLDEEPSGPITVQVSITDAFGNSGTVEQTF